MFDYQIIAVIGTCVLAYVVGYKVGRINSFNEGYMQGIVDLTEAVQTAINKEKETSQ